MKAPDKIYVNIPGDYWHTVDSDKTVNDIEYIRKDALMEWIDKCKNYSFGPSWELLKTHIETLC